MSIVLKPIGPASANHRGENELVPQTGKPIDIDELLDVLFGAFAQYLFIHPAKVPPVVEVVGQRGTAPSDMERQLDEPSGSDLVRVVVGRRQRDRAAVWAQQSVSLSHRTKGTATWVFTSAMLEKPNIAPNKTVLPRRARPTLAQVPAGLVSQSRENGTIRDSAPVRSPARPLRQGYP